MFNQPEGFAEVTIVANFLDVPQRTVQAWAKYGRVSSQLIGRLWYINVKEAQEYKRTRYRGRPIMRGVRTTAS